MKKIILHLCADIGSDSRFYDLSDEYEVIRIGEEIGVEKRGSTKGLLWRDDSGKWWSDDDVKAIYAGVDYRVAPKKVNDPDDPTTWEEGVAIFRRDEGDDTWILDVFRSYSGHVLYNYCTEHSRYQHAKLATPKQIEAWKLINGEL